MRKVIVTICLICCFVLTKVEAVLFDDGGTHNIDYIINPGVEVRDDDFFDRITAINILDGAQLSSLKAYERSVVNIYGGYGGLLNAYDNSVITALRGSLSGLTVRDASTAVVSGTSIGSYGLFCLDNSGGVVVSGGIVEGDLYVFGFGILEMSGGTIGGEIKVTYTSSVPSIVTFIGNDFTINGVPVDFGFYSTKGKDAVHVF